MGMYGCINVASCHYQNMAYMNMITWPEYAAEGSMHVLNDPKETMDRKRVWFRSWQHRMLLFTFWKFIH